MITGMCDGCHFYFVTEPLEKFYDEYWRAAIFLCNDCANDPNLDREAVAASVD